jgi:hypothetical protein
MDGARERNRGPGSENRQHQRQRDKFPHIIKPFPTSFRTCLCGDWLVIVQCAKWDAALQ